jgi:hypothetical protein
MDDRTKESMRPKDKHRRKVTKKPRAVKRMRARLKAILEKYASSSR